MFIREKIGILSCFCRREKGRFTRERERMGGEEGG